jgi:hypothetical protein
MSPGRRWIRLRLRYAADLIASKLADELERQQQKLIHWVKAVKVPGTGWRLGQLLEDTSVTDAAESGVLTRVLRHRQQTAEMIRELRQLAEAHAMVHREFRSAEQYPETWTDDLRARSKRTAHDGRMLGVWGPESASKMADEPLARAAWIVSEWIRARHRNARGELDQDTYWPDVAVCLEWHGHEGETADGLRLRVERLTQSLSRSALP